MKTKNQFLKNQMKNKTENKNIQTLDIQYFVLFPILSLPKINTI